MGGGGSTYDYGFRIYNPQIAKFLSVDPLSKEYPMLTPYQFASNSPISNIDLDGLEAQNATQYKYTGNVIIIFLDSDVKYSIQKNSNWDYIVANDIVDAVSKLKTYSSNEKIGGKVDNVVISVHGNDDYLALKGYKGLAHDNNSIDYVPITSSTVGKYMNPDIKLKEKYNTPLVALDEIGGLIKDNGSLIISACFAGSNGKLGKSISKMEGLQGKYVFLNGWYGKGTPIGPNLAWEMTERDLSAEGGVSPGQGFSLYKNGTGVNLGTNLKLNGTGEEPFSFSGSQGSFQIMKDPQIDGGGKPDKKPITSGDQL